MSESTEVKGHELFTSLSLESVQKIKDITEVKEFKAGDAVFEPNQKANNVYILLNGLMALRFPSKEEAFSAGLIRIEKDQLIGAGALLGSSTYTTQAYCVEDCQVMEIDGDKFRDILEEDRIAGFDVTRKIAQVYFERYISLMGKIQTIFT